MFLGARCDEITPKTGVNMLVHLPHREIHLVLSDPFNLLVLEQEIWHITSFAAGVKQYIC